MATKTSGGDGMDYKKLEDFQLFEEEFENVFE